MEKMAKKKQKQKPPKKSSMTLIYVAAALVVIAALAVYISYKPAAETPPEKLPSTGEYLKLNKPTTYEPGKVRIIEFLKFDCSHCYDLHKNLPQLLEKYGDNVNITYVPIIWQGQSTKSIEAYIIAEQMGKGEEMQDALFTAEFSKGMDIMGSIPALENVASGIGLGTDFNARLEGNDARNAALANLNLMRDYDVQGTPTLIINGNLMVNPPTAENLDKIISSLLS